MYLVRRHGTTQEAVKRNWFLGGLGRCAKAKIHDKNENRVVVSHSDGRSSGCSGLRSRRPCFPVAGSSKHVQFECQFWRCGRREYRHGWRDFCQHRRNAAYPGPKFSFRLRLLNRRRWRWGNTYPRPLRHLGGEFQPVRSRKCHRIRLADQHYFRCTDHHSLIGKRSRSHALGYLWQGCQPIPRNRK